MPPTRDRIVAALRRLGPSTALDLQDATGITATSIRPVLTSNLCEFVGWKWEGRRRQKVYQLKEQEQERTGA